MLPDRPPAWTAVDVRPLAPNAVLPKFTSVDTWTLYVAAPVTVLQLRISEVSWFVAPFEGEASIGAAGTAMIVVKLHTLDHMPVPPAFVALTSQ